MKINNCNFFNGSNSINYKNTKNNFDFELKKKNVISSLNEVEFFLRDFRKFFKCIKLYRFIKY